MTVKTRYFVIVSLLVVGVGLGTGLVAYYVGFPTSAFIRGGPEELRYLPSTATVVAYADVQQVMASELRQRFRESVLPGAQENGQREFQDLTGINIETDLDHVVACLDATGTGANNPGSGVVLAKGRFAEVKIEALMREHGAHVENYSSKRLIVADPDDRDVTPGDGVARRHGSFAVSFMEPGLAAIGSTSLIRTAIDLHRAGNNPQKGLESVTGNDELMNLVRSMDDGNAWAVGRFDALSSQHLPAGIMSQLPAITWFSVSGHVNGGIRGVLRAETRDEEAANNLRDVVRGFMALAKLQAGSRPEFQAMMQSLELGGSGKTVALSFAVPAEVFDIIGAVANKAVKPEVH